MAPGLHLLPFLPFQNDVLDRLGPETPNWKGLDGWSAQRSVSGRGPWLAHWAYCGLPQWQPDLLVWLEGKYCWVHEARWHRQESCDFRRSVIWSVGPWFFKATKGNATHACMHVSSVSDIGHPYSLDVFEGHLYWTSKDTGEVWRTNKFGNGNKVKVLTVNPWLTQVHVYQEHRYNQTGQGTQVLFETTTYFSMSKSTSALSSPKQDLIFLLTFLPVPNPCKSICSHLCLLRPGGYTCACPQGSSLSEGNSGTCDAGKDCVCLSAAHLRSWTSPSTAALQLY